MRACIALGLAAFVVRVQDKELPKPVQAAYDDFVRVLEKGNPDEIKAAMLAGAVEITSQPRKDNAEYGTDINLPFLSKGFRKEVMNTRKEKDGTYLVRTSSSYLRFVETKQGWRLYRYGDKPIE